MTPLRVFATFDCERDEDLLKRLVAESKTPGANFTVFDRSSKEPPTDEAAEKIRKRIERCDALIVLCGIWTHRAPNVTREVRLAQEAGKRYYLIKGRTLVGCSRPTNARISDKMFKWTKGLIDELVLRNI